MRDLTKLGFADDLALEAGLEEDSRTCCLRINFTGASTHHWAGGN